MFVPVHFDDPFGCETPVFEMFPDPQRADHGPDAIAQSRHGPVIQMVPMVVRDDQAVDLGHIVGRKHIRALERAEKQRHGPPIGKNRIDQHTLPAELQQIG